MPAGLTIAGVPSRVMPMKPTLTPCTVRVVYAGRIGLPVVL